MVEVWQYSIHFTITPGLTTHILARDSLSLSWDLASSYLLRLSFLQVLVHMCAPKYSHSLVNLFQCNFLIAISMQVK